MQLSWDINKQYGFLDIVPRDYNEEYFNKYKNYEKTDFGKDLNRKRVEFIARNYEGELLDIGVGSLQFLKSRPNTFGYDINEVAVAKLKEHDRYVNPYETTYPFAAYSFFDSFEHISDHVDLLGKMPKDTFVFMSIPIFRDVSHVFLSKHFRTDEHYWYFTTYGLIRYMLDHKFVCVDLDNFEIRIGREDILSFAFKKV